MADAESLLARNELVFQPGSAERELLAGGWVVADIVGQRDGVGEADAWGLAILEELGEMLDNQALNKTVYCHIGYHSFSPIIALCSHD